MLPLDLLSCISIISADRRKARGCSTINIVIKFLIQSFILFLQSHKSTENCLQLNKNYLHRFKNSKFQRISQLPHWLHWEGSAINGLSSLDIILKEKRSQDTTKPQKSVCMSNCPERYNIDGIALLVTQPLC